MGLSSSGGFDRENDFYNLFENMLTGIIVMEVIYNKDGQPVDHRLLQANAEFERQTGLKRDNEVGKTRAELSFKWPEDVCKRYYSIANEGGVLYWERYNESLKKYYDVRVFSPRRGQFALMFYDITERKRSDEQIHRLAYYDQLTGLPNRRLFRDQLEQEMKRVVLNKSSLALLFIDLDRFKEVNDTLGHDKGDKLLIEATRRIWQHVRETDTFARLGGDEFTIVLPEFGDSLNIDRVAQNVLRELKAPFDLGDGDRGHISGSVGIVLYPQDAGNIEELLKHADQAMYAAKAEGRNRYSYFKASMQQTAREKLELSNDLRYALPRGELEVYYQPIVELKTGRIGKAEALARWHHPVRGMVSPAQFIPLAEEFGIINDIGNWIFLQSVAAIADWRRHLGVEVQVSVNRSPMEFDKEQFDWIEMLESVELPGSAVVMEVTEGMLLKESGYIRDQLMDCRNNGIEVSIDDFGTGYSALSYLKQFDIDYLKIDQSFVRNVTQDKSDKALVEAIILMAHKLGIKTIAEGVETEEQRDLLLSFNCDYAQGYLYSKPVPINEFKKLLTK